jgi:hypothetical protein
MRLLLIGFMLLLPLPAWAQFVDPMYGNPKFPNENYRPMPGGAAYRDLDGRTHFEYVKPSFPTPQSTPSSPPSVHSQPQHERYEALRDVAPDTGQSYQPNSILYDRVPY